MPPSRDFIAEQYRYISETPLELVERMERKKSEPITGGEWWRFLHPGEPEEPEDEE